MHANKLKHSKWVHELSVQSNKVEQGQVDRQNHRGSQLWMTVWNWLQWCKVACHCSQMMIAMMSLTLYDIWQLWLYWLLIRRRVNNVSCVAAVSHCCMVVVSVVLCLAATCSITGHADDAYNASITTSCHSARQRQGSQGSRTAGSNSE